VGLEDFLFVGRFLSTGQSRSGDEHRTTSVGFDDYLPAELPQKFYSC
jgi:hypothetical protein